MTHRFSSILCYDLICSSNKVKRTTEFRILASSLDITVSTFSCYYSQARSSALRGGGGGAAPPPPPPPKISLLLERQLVYYWKVESVGSCRFQVIHLSIHVCVTSSEFTHEVVIKLLPAEFERKSKTHLHRLSLLWFLWLRRIIKAFIFLLLQACLLVIYSFCKI